MSFAFENFAFKKCEFENFARRKIKRGMTTASILGGTWDPAVHGTQSGPVGVGAPSPGKLFHFTIRSFCPGFDKPHPVWQVFYRC